MMTPAEVEARFQRIEALQASNAEHIAMLLEDAKTRNADIEKLIDETRLLNEQGSKLDSHMAKLTETMDRLANIVIRHEERLDEIQGEQ